MSDIASHGMPKVNPTRGRLYHVGVKLPKYLYDPFTVLCAQEERSGSQMMRLLLKRELDRVGIPYERPGSAE